MVMKNEPMKFRTTSICVELENGKLVTFEFDEGGSLELVNGFTEDAPSPTGVSIVPTGQITIAIKGKLNYEALHSAKMRT